MTKARFDPDEQGLVAAKIRTLAPVVRALAAAAPCSSKQCSLAATRYACLQQQQQQQQQQKHLQDQYRVRRHAPDLRRYDALSRLNLGRFRGAETALLA